jgi:hypothetical protein
MLKSKILAAHCFGHSNFDRWIFFRVLSAFAEAATRRQVLRISNFELLCN